MSITARKILLLAGRLGVRGEGSRLGLLASRLAGLGLAVEVVCVDGGSPAPAIPGLVEAPGLGGRFLRGRAIRRLVEGDGDGPKPTRPDLLHIIEADMGPIGLALADRWRIPYVLAVDEFLPPGGRIRISRRWCRALVVPGRSLADDLVAQAGVPASLIAVVPPGVGIPEQAPVPPEPGPVSVVGTAGPLTPGAGLATFLDAARRVVDSGIDAEFVIAGHGPGEADFRRQAERLRLAERVTFARPPEPDAPFWEVLDAFCLSPLGPTIGPTLGTALAHGLPAIASDVEGLRDWIPPDGGWLVRPGDPAVLARAILNVLADRAAARKIGRRGRAWIARSFDPDVEARALVDLYHRILDPTAPRPSLDHDASPVPGSEPIRISTTDGSARIRLDTGPASPRPDSPAIPRAALQVRGQHSGAS